MKQIILDSPSPETEIVGFEPTCPFGQPHFECGSLQPLRYISNVLYYITFSSIRSSKFNTLKRKQPAQQFFLLDKPSFILYEPRDTNIHEASRPAVFPLFP